MVSHVSYETCRCDNPAACIEEIRAHVDRGWMVSEIRGPSDGPFFVLFRKDER